MTSSIEGLLCAASPCSSAAAAVLIEGVTEVDCVVGAGSAAGSSNTVFSNVGAATGTVEVAMVGGAGWVK